MMAYMYLSLHLIANNTLELVHENAPKWTILKFKKNKKFSGEGAMSRAEGTLRLLRFRRSSLRCPCAI